MGHALERVIQQTPGGRRVLIAAVGLGALAVIWAFAQWASRPTMVPVMRNAPAALLGQVTSKLDEAGIAYSLDPTGSGVSVPEPDAARVRVLLASEGITDAESPGFELFDQASWGMTDFTQRVNYRRALEGELERTIARLRGVEAADVHLSLQEGSFLRGGDAASEASVVLDLSLPGAADEAMVRGIQSLVANSVERLEPERVAVLDETGRLLSDEGAAGAGLSDRQLEVRRSHEQYLESKAMDLLAQAVGRNNARVRVSAEMNFDQIERAVNAVDPDQQVVLTEGRSEVVPGTAEQGASQVQTNTAYETTRSTETLRRAGARVERLTVAVAVNHRVITADDGTTTLEPRTPEELRQIEALVRNAVGVDEDRGDAISVANLPFEAPPPAVPVEPGVDVVGVLQASQRPLVGLAGIAMALFLALRVMSTIRALEPSRPSGPQLALVPEGPEPAQLSGHRASEPDIVPAPPTPTRVVDPEMTARVLKTWLKEG
ncbi:MAG: flagellar M-ring protein FliF [Gemmatimonadetes bacterium]|nr:MAG: flagellar M-ring protein FliF [Gemmatimonadota bacterium]